MASLWCHHIGLHAFMRPSLKLATQRNISQLFPSELAHLKHPIGADGDTVGLAFATAAVDNGSYFACMICAG